jgi:allantoinase
MNDLLIRNALVVEGGAVKTSDVAVTAGRISAVGPSLPGSARREIDASGLHLFPGFIDAHVHFNEPGRADWEGLSSGSAALAAGGGTAFFDMPLNSDPPVLDRGQFEAKRGLAAQKSLLDFALWGGLCPGHTDKINEMAEAGAVGFKAFLCPSGIDEFPATDPATLREGLKLAKRWKLPVAVHAEDPTALATAEPKGRTMRDFLDSRPKAAEVEAVRWACEAAGETGASLHIVHVSCAEALEEITRAKQAGVDVTTEVCSHHLLFNAADAERLGARAKCAPPLREDSDVLALWKSLLAGAVDTIGSDHSPAPPDRKTGEDFFAIWGGISGCQHAFPALLGALSRRTPERLAAAADWMARNPAERFGLPHKGRVVPGFDADLTLVKFGEFPAIEPSTLLYRHPMSLYEGCRPTCRVVHVFRQGENLVHNGTIVPTSTRGRFLRPDPT